MRKASHWFWGAVLLVSGQVSLFAQVNFADTIWAGTLTGKTKEVAHYQANAKGASVTGPRLIKFPQKSGFPRLTHFALSLTIALAVRALLMGEMVSMFTIPIFTRWWWGKTPA